MATLHSRCLIPQTRRGFLAAATLGLGGLAAACGSPVASQKPKAAPKAAPPREEPPVVAPTPEVVTYTAQGPAKVVDYLELPLRLVIPRIGVLAPVIAVGLTPQGAMDVPQQAYEVGWYEYSPRPGTKGNSVLAGHLDWYGADGVFRRLNDVGPGDAVIVRAADGKERSYQVQWREEYPVTSAPVAKVFEPVEQPALTLITCGGRWNPVTKRYDTRVVVRAAQ